MLSSFGISTWALLVPYSVPMSVFWDSTRLSGLIGRLSAVAGVRPITTTVPSFAVAAYAWPMVSGLEIASKAKSTPAPSVISITLLTTSVLLALMV